MRYLFIFLFSASTVFSYAEDSIPAFDAIDYTTYRNHFYFNPISPLFQSFEVGFERMDEKFANSLAVFTGVIMRDDNSNFGSFNEQYFALKLNAQYRFGIVNKASARIKRKRERITQQNVFVYLSPYVSIKYGDRSSQSEQFVPNPNNPGGPFISQTIVTVKQGSAFGGGVVFGGRWTFGKRFDMDVYLGGGAQYSTSNRNSNFNNGFNFDFYRVFYSGITPVLGYSLGLSF